MINWKTILSTFNDKPTLLQWLKIVEKALQNATLESVTAKTAPNNAVAFEFKFADGSTVTSTAANLEAKGISGIEEVSDEVVGNQTLTTLRVHYTDDTKDEIPVYAENGTQLYYHKISGKGTKGSSEVTFLLRALSSTATLATDIPSLQKIVTNAAFCPAINTTEGVIFYDAKKTTNSVFVAGIKFSDNSGYNVNVTAITNATIIKI